MRLRRKQNEPPATAPSPSPDARTQEAANDELPYLALGPLRCMDSDEGRWLGRLLDGAEIHHLVTPSLIQADYWLEGRGWVIVHYALHDGGDDTGLELWIFTRLGYSSGHQWTLTAPGPRLVKAALAASETDKIITPTANALIPGVGAGDFMAWTSPRMTDAIGDRALALLLSEGLFSSLGASPDPERLGGLAALPTPPMRRRLAGWTHTPLMDALVPRLVDAGVDLAPVLPTLIAGYACDAFSPGPGHPGGLDAGHLSMLTDAVVGVHEVVEASPSIRDVLGPARWLSLVADVAGPDDA